MSLSLDSDSTTDQSESESGLAPTLDITHITHTTVTDYQMFSNEYITCEVRGGAMGMARGVTAPYQRKKDKEGKNKKNQEKVRAK